MTTRNVVAILHCFVLASCATKSNETVRLLTDNGHKYWDYYRSGFKTGSYRFSMDGKCFYLKYNRMDGSRALFQADDVLLPHSWVLYPTEIDVLGRRYKIAKMKADSIVLTRGEDSTLLIPSADQKDTHDFDELN